MEDHKDRRVATWADIGWWALGGVFVAVFLVVCGLLDNGYLR